MNFKILAMIVIPDLLTPGTKMNLKNATNIADLYEKSLSMLFSKVNLSLV